MKKKCTCLLALLSILIIFSLCIPIHTYAEGEQSYSVTEYHATARITSKNSLNLRSGPSTDYSVLKSLPTGTEITIIGKTDNNWYQIQIDDQVGFVAAKYVSEPVEIIEMQSEEELFPFPFTDFSMVDSSFLTILVVAIILVIALMLITLAQVISLTQELSKSRTYYSRRNNYEDEDFE